MNNETSIQKRGPSTPEVIEQQPAVAPLVDIYENNDELLLVADLPGVSKDNLKVHLEKGQLRIDGHRVEATEGEGISLEYRPLDFRRTFAVPQGIDADHIRAELNQGVLRLHMPRTAAAKPRQIAIKAG